jgi:hypothetical protein
MPGQISLPVHVRFTAGAGWRLGLTGTVTVISYSNRYILPGRGPGGGDVTSQISLHGPAALGREKFDLQPAPVGAWVAQWQSL